MSGNTISLNLQRVVKRRHEDALRSQLKTLRRVAEGGASNSVDVRMSKLGKPEEVPDGFLFRASMKISKHSPRSSESRIASLLEKAVERVKSKATMLYWQVVDDKVEPTPRVEIPGVNAPLPEFSAPPLTEENMQKYFGKIYERDSHIYRIHSTVCSYIQSGKQRRNAILLHGEPAAAKTVLIGAFKRFYEDFNGGEQVKVFDATTATKSGIERELVEAAAERRLSPILVFEEIDKHDMSKLLSLLSVMDARATLTRLNARVGHIEAKIDSLIWATCNNDSIVQEWQRGALWSRFSHRLYCQRPSIEVLRQILYDKVSEIRGGKKEWADAVIEFLVKHDDPSRPDPRYANALLDGGEMLLNGSYQKMILNTTQRTEINNE